MNAPAHNVKELTVMNSPFKKLSSLTASLIDMHPCGILTVPWLTSGYWVDEWFPQIMMFFTSSTWVPTLIAICKGQKIIIRGIGEKVFAFFVKLDNSEVWNLRYMLQNLATYGVKAMLISFYCQRFFKAFIIIEKSLILLKICLVKGTLIEFSYLIKISLRNQHWLQLGKQFFTISCLNELGFYVPNSFQLFFKTSRV